MQRLFNHKQERGTSMGRKTGIPVNPRPDRAVVTNYEHRKEAEVVKKEALYLKRMQNILNAMQQTIYEAPGVPVLSEEIKPLATAVITAFLSMEKEAKILMNRRNRP
jgi:hypothetical protein